MDRVLKNISGSGRVSGTRWTLLLTAKKRPILTPKYPLCPPVKVLRCPKLIRIVPQAQKKQLIISVQLEQNWFQAMMYFQGSI